MNITIRTWEGTTVNMKTGQTLPVINVELPTTDNEQGDLAAALHIARSRHSSAQWIGNDYGSKTAVFTFEIR